VDSFDLKSGGFIFRLGIFGSLNININYLFNINCNNIVIKINIWWVGGFGGYSMCNIFFIPKF